MAEKLWFVPDHKSMAEFLVSEQMRDVTEEVASDIAIAARSLANRDASQKRRTHHYADAFKVKREGGVLKVGKTYGNLRVMVLVENDDPVALYNEFGNRKSKRRRTLARAGALFGDLKTKDAEEFIG